jgi:hypothetical protein
MRGTKQNTNHQILFIWFLAWSQKCEKMIDDFTSYLVYRRMAIAS